MQNKEFRKKVLKGAKVEDLYFYLEKMKEEDKNFAEEVQRFIEFNFGYEPVAQNQK